MNVWTILLAAGSGSRMTPAKLSTRKQFLTVDGEPLFWKSAAVFSRVAGIHGIVFVFPPDECETQTRHVIDLDRITPLNLAWKTAAGGERRQDSLGSGLAALPEECTHVLVHDAARCFVTAAVIANVLEALKRGARAAIPAIAVTDTIKEVSDMVVAATPDRGRLMAVQTPQGIERAALGLGLAKARREGLTVTDDASLAEAIGLPVHVVVGTKDNVKITTPEDLRLLAAPTPTPLPRVGFGYDAHRYATADTPEAKSRPMTLGSAPIPGAPRVLAHSDVDVLLHALADALLGCLCQGDIGQHFPDFDPQYLGVASSILASEILARFGPAKLVLVHVDLTIVAQTPKISPHREHIRRNVAGLLGLPVDRVNVKATTEEGMGFTGEKLGIKAYATATAVSFTLDPVSTALITRP